MSRASGRTPSVLLADGQVPTRVGTKLAIEAGGYTVVAEAGNAGEAVGAALACAPEICLVADDLPGGGIVAVERIAAALPSTTIAIISASESPTDLLTAVLAGANGYVLETVNPDRLPLALDALLDGQVVLPRTLTGSLVAELRRLNSLRDSAEPSVRDPTALTQREADVLRLRRQGMSTANVAEQLCISPVTVRRHLSNSLQKLGEHGRQRAVG